MPVLYCDDWNVYCTLPAGCASQSLEGRLVFAKPALANVPLTNAAAVRGNVVVVMRDTPTLEPLTANRVNAACFGVKAEHVEAAGGCGMVVVNFEPEPLPFLLSSDLPAVMIGSESGARMRDGQQVRLDCTSDDCTVKDQGRTMRESRSFLLRGGNLKTFSRKGHTRDCPIRLSSDETCIKWISNGMVRKLELGKVRAAVAMPCNFAPPLVTSDMCR